MTLCILESFERLTDHMNECPLGIGTSEADGVKVALEELKNAQVRRYEVLRCLLLPEESSLIRRCKFLLQVERIGKEELLAKNANSSVNG